MVQFEFFLSREDFDRLYAIKKEMGYDNLTGNQFAQLLLEIELHRLHPRKVQDDELDERKGSSIGSPMAKSTTQNL